MTKAIIDPRHIIGDTGNRLYLGVGRIPGDEGDTATLIQAASDYDATEALRRWIIDDANLTDRDIQALKREYDDICCVTSLYEVGQVQEVAC